jgi:hypothetical protein
LEAANYLNSVAYNFDINNPPEWTNHFSKSSQENKIMGNILISQSANQEACFKISDLER